MKKFPPPWLIVLVLATAGWFGCRHSLNRSSSDPTIEVSGNIEIVDAELSFRIGGRVETRAVDEGQPIQQGQLVAELEAQDLKIEVSLREAELGIAEAALAELEAGYRPEEIAQAQATLEFAVAEAERARLDFERLKSLRAQQVATARDYELAEAALKTGDARVREAQARLTLLRKGPRVEEIDQARARVDQARQALALARTRLGYTRLVSPWTGVVLSRNTEPGEYVSPGTAIVTVGDLARPWLRAYINETDLGRVKLGQDVDVTTDTFPDRVYHGRVTFIASQAEFTPRNVQTRKERVKLVYRIKVDIANPELELKPGMPADARIKTAPAATP